MEKTFIQPPGKAAARGNAEGERLNDGSFRLRLRTSREGNRETPKLSISDLDLSKQQLFILTIHPRRAKTARIGDPWVPVIHRAARQSSLAL